MPEYYLRRLTYKVLSWFIPKREWRVAFGKKMGFGERVVSVEEVDLYIPRDILDSINSASGGHSALSDKSGNLRSDFQSLTSSKLLQSSLENNDFSSKILECPGKPSVECKADSESKKRLESHFDTLDSNTESSSIDSESKKALESSSTDSKTITQSPTSKNLNKALPNTNNSVCDSTSLAQLQNCAIFATQKSNQISRAEHPQEASSGWGGEVERGGGSDLAIQAPSPLSHKTSDIEKLGNIRKEEILRNEKIQNLNGIESKVFTESSHIDSATFTESKGILKNERTQNLGGTESTSTDSQTHNRDLHKTDSKICTESKADSKAFTESSPLDSQPKAIAQSSPLDSQSKPTNTQAQNQANTAQDRIYNPNPFLHTYKARLDPTPLATIVARHSSFAPPPFVA